METIKDYLSNIEDQLDRMEDYLEACKGVPFSPKVSVDKHAIYDIIDIIRPVIDDAKNDLPNEIKQARRIISDGDKILTDAKNKASLILKAAESEAEKLVDEHELVKRATIQSSQIMDESRKSARELRKNAIEYADEILSKTEEAVRSSMDNFTTTTNETQNFFSNTVDVLYENRKELRGIKD